MDDAITITIILHDGNVLIRQAPSGYLWNQALLNPLLIS